jgi:hypothetical protein
MSLVLPSFMTKISDLVGSLAKVWLTFGNLGYLAEVAVYVVVCALINWPIKDLLG